MIQVLKGTSSWVSFYPIIAKRSIGFQKKAVILILKYYGRPWGSTATPLYKMIQDSNSC